MRSPQMSQEVQGGGSPCSKLVDSDPLNKTCFHEVTNMHAILHQIESWIFKCKASPKRLYSDLNLRLKSQSVVASGLTAG